jgi:hypothetical protein
VSGDLRHEAEATLAARREVGRELEPQLVERFADRVEEEIERRAHELAAKQRPEHHSITPLVLGSLGIAIPLMGIAGGTAGLSGVIAVCIAIVLVNLFWASSFARRSRR